MNSYKKLGEWGGEVVGGGWPGYSLGVIICGICYFLIGYDFSAGIVKKLRGWSEGNFWKVYYPSLDIPEDSSDFVAYESTRTVLQESMKKTQPNKYQVCAEYFFLAFVHWLDKSWKIGISKFCYDFNGIIGNTNWFRYCSQVLLYIIQGDRVNTTPSFPSRPTSVHTYFS